MDPFAAGPLPIDQLEAALDSLDRNAQAQVRLVEELLDISRIVALKASVARRNAKVDLVKLGKGAVMHANTFVRSAAVRS